MQWLSVGRSCENEHHLLVLKNGCVSLFHHWIIDSIQLECTSRSIYSCCDGLVTATGVATAWLAKV